MNESKRCNPRSAIKDAVKQQSLLRFSPGFDRVSFATKALKHRQIFLNLRLGLKTHRDEGWFTQDLSLFFFE